MNNKTTHYEAYVFDAQGEPIPLCGGSDFNHFLELLNQFPQYEVDKIYLDVITTESLSLNDFLMNKTQ